MQQRRSTRLWQRTSLKEAIDEHEIVAAAHLPRLGGLVSLDSFRRTRTIPKFLFCFYFEKKVELISYRKKDVSGLDRVTQEVLLRGTLFNGLYRLSLPSEHKALLGEITPAYIWHLIYLI